MRKLVLAAVLAFGGALAARAEEHAEALPGEKEKPKAEEPEVHHAAFLGLFLVQVAGFVCLIILLKKLVIPVIAKGLKDRADKIEKTYEKLEAEKKEVERLTKEMQDRLSRIEEEAKKKTEQAVREGTEARTAIVADAEAAAVRILAKAKSEIEMERVKAIEEIRQEMARLALEAAEKICRQSMNPAAQEELVERFLNEIDRVKA